MIRLGVVGHPGYDGLPAVLATLTNAAERFGIEPLVITVAAQTKALDLE